MHVLITGIGGFIGPRLARNLLEHGHRVSGTWLENTPPPNVEGADLYHADLMDRSSLDRVFEVANPDAVVHLAGLSSVGDSWKRPGEYFRVNVLGTENLLAAAGERRVVFASSAEVYGQVPEEEQPIHEERLPDPRSPYALTKAAAERIALASGAVVARAFNLVGAGQAPGFVLPSFARQLTEPVLKVGNLTARRDFIHVDDGADAFRVLIESGQPGHIYNIASGQALSIAEVLDRLCAVAGLKPPVEEDPDRMRPVDVPLLRGDNGRLRKLGWEPRQTLDQALSDLWADSLSYQR
ncbi:MAG: GDP-4-dehydro-6-deoxy-D-mannose reductase [Acidobacteriota bacterium]|jgi:GDP-4-dehydro-6-deoxy-D-mannose reductase|nr:GDP-4-dehydro-6-deoxy-D-mannose reductase [Acidobacteriota bacterium]